VKGLFLVGVVILGALAVWGGIRLALNTEYPVLVVSSGSMCQRLTMPTNDCTLAIGDLIVIRGQDPSTINPGPPPSGSIIVFRPPPPFNTNDPNYLVVHRAIRHNAANPNNFDTRGDANGVDDPWDSSAGGVPASRIVGVYQNTVPIPYLGSAILSLRAFMYDEATGQPRPQGLAIIVALIVALFAFEVIEPNKKKSSPPKPPSPPSPSVQPQGKG
jgi:signal peptidase I